MVSHFGKGELSVLISQFELERNPAPGFDHHFRFLIDRNRCDRIKRSRLGEPQ